MKGSAYFSTGGMLAYCRLNTINLQFNILKINSLVGVLQNRYDIRVYYGTFGNGLIAKTGAKWNIYDFAKHHHEYIYFEYIKYHISRVSAESFQLIELVIQ